MNKLRVGSVLLLGLLMAGMSGVALARDGRGGYSGPRYSGHANVGVGVVINPLWYAPGYYTPYYYPRAYSPPYYYPPYYYSPYYYPPSVVAVPTEPPVYIEREAVDEPMPQTSAAWYYCADPQGYYPDVKACPGGWQAVAPLPSDSSDEGR